MNRVLAAARLPLVHPTVILGVPWMVGALSFAINWAVWRIVDIRSLEGEDGFTGGVLALLDAVESATGGWGVGLHFWTPPPLDVDGFLPQVAVSRAPMLALIAAGVGMGVVAKRWGPNGVWGLIVGSVVVLGGAAVLITWMRAWLDLGRWLADQSLMTLAVGLPLALAAVLGLLAFAGIRRVVP
jgi:hypothetical protein